MSKHQILNLIATKPKHYTKIIKKNKILMDWIENNSLINSDNFIEHIYSAVHQETNICENGNKKKISRINDGWVGCGPSKSCECVRNQIAQNVKKSKSLISEEDQININLKRDATMIEKYGCKVNSQRLEIRKLLSKPKISPDVFSKLTDKDWMQEEYVNKKRSMVDIADELGTYYGTVCDYLQKFNFKIRKKTNYSLVELEVGKFLQTLNIKFNVSNWDILKSKEIDIYIPDHKIAIEINGLYWNSSKNIENENKTKHLDKTELCENLGIQLLHITDYEWINQKDIIKNLIRSKLNLNNKIYARKCLFKNVSKKESKEFLKKHHIQGNVISQYQLGLYYNEELVMLMTLGRNRFKKSSDLEILRICSKENTNVIGGLSKLLKYAKKISLNLTSYCSRDKSTGNGYVKSGFKLVKKTKPGYFWTDGTLIISRYKAQKKQLEKWLPVYDSSLSESENMFKAGFRRYWDCGNLVFYT